MKRLLQAAGIAAMLGLVVVLVVAVENSRSKDAFVKSVAAGRLPAAPAFDLPSLDGKGRVRLADYRGKIVVVNFWASWCGPCRSEAPQLVAFARSHPDVQMLSVNSADLSRAAAVEFAARSKWTWPNVFDPSGGIQHAWGVGGLPATFLVDADGKLRSRKLGETTEAELTKLVAAL